MIDTVHTYIMNVLMHRQGQTVKKQLQADLQKHLK